MTLRRERANRAGHLIVFVLASASALIAGGALVPGLSYAATPAKPLVVQRRVVTVPGLQGTRLGPRSIVVRFSRPTTRGDLLVAGVDDGVETSGMSHAHYLFPGWRRAVTTIGGQTASTGAGAYATGGLQAAIYFYPNNPGGISEVQIATIPPKSLDWVSVVMVELANVPSTVICKVAAGSRADRG